MTRAVLTFHSVDDSGSVLSFPTSAFRNLVELLAEAQTPVLAFPELLQSQEGLTFTFDDGMRTVHQHALPVLRHHGFPAHVFLTTGHVGKDMTWPSGHGRLQAFDILGWREVDECLRSGFRVECHTVTHPDLRELSSTGIIDECCGADDEIERQTGQRPTLFAFPFGHFDDRVRSLLAPRYAGCFTTRLGYFGRAEDLTRIRRLDSYYLQSSVWYKHLFATTTRGYIASRALIRAVRGVT
jgi:peptidoglycan/xylan/chitin deacetylase (PgdA/CDA1 family)